MSEVKKLFLGKMNKDVDERFIEPRDYIDALNVDVAHSEGGDAGTVRPKVGNIDVTGHPYIDATTVGVFKYTPDNVVFSFIYSEAASAIVEYNQVTGVTTPVLVDTRIPGAADSRVLRWNADTKITGIQIIEGTLGWVVEGENPMAIDVTAFKTFTAGDFNLTTQVEGENYLLEDVTMVRQKPLTAPTIVANRTTREGRVAFVTFQNFAETPTQTGTLTPAKAVGDSITITSSLTNAIEVGDRLILTSPAPSTITEFEEFELRVEVTGVALNGTSIEATITTITDPILDDILEWNVLLIQGKPMYELEFPRFAYRWKYTNNQYSTISPWTQPVFLGDPFEYNSNKGHNTGMTNNVRSITVSDFGVIPHMVERIEVLITTSNDQNVYIVDSVDIDQSELTITSEMTSNLVSSDQLLRPDDKLPKSALALEAATNRFVIGNYTQGYDVDESTIKFESAVLRGDKISDIGVPQESIKSLRSYQGGVVFLDELGRETPVFSDVSGSIKADLKDASTANKFGFKMEGAPPSFATHFKYFIKDTSQEYYNLAADRLYQSSDKLSTWISFPSSERNKVDEDTYLVAKKVHDKDTPISDDGNKFKILAIADSVPEEISTRRTEVYESQIWFDSNFGDGNEQTTQNIGSTPSAGSKVFLISSDQQNGSSGVSTPLKELLIKGSFITFKTGSSQSKVYKVASVAFSQDSKHMKVYVDVAFGQDVNFLYTDPTSPGSAMTVDRPVLTIYEEQEVADQDQFLGRFFVKLAYAPLLDTIFAASENYVTVNAANTYDGGYINGDVNFKIWAGGASPRLDYSVDRSLGGLGGVDRPPSWANDNTDVIYDILFEKRHRNPIDNSFIAAISTPGTRIRFSNHPTVYTIVASRSWYTDYKDNDFTRYYTLFDRRLEATVNPYVLGESVTVEIVELERTEAFTVDSPAIFETEPKERVDLDVYYEASDALPISDYNTKQILPYYNCFSYGNGVESNRIRDDFNAPYIRKGIKVSVEVDDVYREEHNTNTLIYGGLKNSAANVNNLNQWLIAESITKVVNPIYGSIQRLFARDTDLLIMCEDKIFQAYIDKSALYNADGSINVTASNAVIGDLRPVVGEFGISKNPESFAAYGYRAYFADKNRGVILRLSADGITPITSGYQNELETQLKQADIILGSYDDEQEVFNITMNGETLSFNEGPKGYTTRWGIQPEWGISLNNTYFTFKNGRIYSHTDLVNRNTWYGEPAQKSTIKFAFNDAPHSIKKFLTLNYEGEAGWIAPSLTTGQQLGQVQKWIEKESKFYHEIRGQETTWDEVTQTGQMDTKEFAIQGIGNASSITGDIVPTEFTITVGDDPADHP